MMEIVRAEGEGSPLFFVLLAGFAFVVLLEYMYPELFRRDTRHLFYFSGLNSEQRNTRTYTAYQVLSVVLFAFTFSVFFSTYLRENYLGEGFSVPFMALVFAGALIYLFFRYLTDMILAWLFDMRAFAQVAIEKGVAMRLAFGVYGLAVFFLCTYSGFSAARFGDNLLLWGFVFYILIYLAVMVEYLLKNAGYFFYFIFYLCIVEICPALIAWNILKQALA